MISHLLLWRRPHRCPGWAGQLSIWKLWASGTLLWAWMIRLGTLLGQARLLPSLLPANPDWPEGKWFLSRRRWYSVCIVTILLPGVISVVGHNQTVYAAYLPFLLIGHYLHTSHGSGSSACSGRWLCCAFIFGWTGSIVYRYSYSGILPGYIFCYTVLLLFWGVGLLTGGGSFSRDYDWFPRAICPSGAASVISFRGWAIRALSASVGFVRRSVSSSTIVLGG